MATLNATNLKHASSGSNNIVLNADGSTTIASGAGKILQVVQAVKTDTFSTTTNTLVDITGLSLSITPSSTSNKILITVSFNHSITTANRWAQFQLVRDSTAIYQGDAADSRTRASIFTSLFDATGRSTHIMNSNIVYLDSPNTTSATTYKLQGNSQSDNTPYLVINRSKDDDNASYGGRTASSITAMEVAA